MLKLQYSGHLVRRTDSLGKNLMLERLKAVGEEGDRGWNCWMASFLTQWTWVWAGSGRWWRTGKPGVLHAVRGVTKTRTRLSDWTTMVLVNLKLVRQPLVLLAGGSLWALCSSSRQGLQGKASRRSNSLGVTGGICGQGWRGSFSSCCSGRVIHATQASAQTSHKVSWKEERQRTGLWGLPPSPAAQSWRAEISSLLTRLSFLGCKIESTLTGRGARRIEWDACGEKGKLCPGKEVLPAKRRLQRGAPGWPNSTLGWLHVDPLSSRTGCSVPEVGAKWTALALKSSCSFYGEDLHCPAVKQFSLLGSSRRLGRGAHFLLFLIPRHQSIQDGDPPSTGLPSGPLLLPPASLLPLEFLLPGLQGGPQSSDLMAPSWSSQGWGVLALAPTVHPGTSGKPPIPRVITST